MDRIWKASLPLGLLLGLIWGFQFFSGVQLIAIPNNSWILGAAIVILVFSVVAFLGRYAAYTQACRDHLLLATPFLRLRISYRRMRRVHPSDFSQLFPPNQASWAQRNFLAPYYSKTAIVIELNGYPLSPSILRLFLAPPMFYRQSPGLVLLVSNWMEFSTELDTFRGVWMRSYAK